MRNKFFWVLTFVFSLLLYTWDFAEAGKKVHPINVLIMVHMEDISSICGWNRPVNPAKTAWQERNENLNWLLKYVASFPPEKRPKLLLEFNGDFAEKLLESKDPVSLENLSLMKRLYKEGFLCFGTHSHIVTKTPDGRWGPFRRGGERNVVNPLKEPEKLKDFDMNEVINALRAHIEAVDRLCREITGREDVENVNNAIIGAYGGRFDTRLKLYSNLLKDRYGKGLPHGFMMETGGERSEPFLSLFSHQPWNPFRAGPYGCMDEEPGSQNYVVIPFGGTIGTAGRHMEGWEYTDCSVPARQREFIHLYLEWLYRIRENRDPDKVWVFGFSIHPYNLYSSEKIKNDPIGLKTLREEFVEMVEWMNRYFINKRTKEGYLIAKYSTTYEIYDEFMEWEKEHQGESSFEYNEKTTDFSKYPYFLKGLAKALLNSHLVSWRKEGDLNVAEFEVCPENCVWKRTVGDRFVCVEKSGEMTAPQGMERRGNRRPPLRNWGNRRGGIPPRPMRGGWGRLPRGRPVPTQKVMVFWSEEGMEVGRGILGVEGWELIDGVTGERIDGETITVNYLPIIAKGGMVKGGFSPERGFIQERECPQRRVSTQQKEFAQLKREGPVKRIEIRLEKGGILGKFNSLNGCFGSGYSPMEGFPHMSEKLKEIGMKVIRFPQDDGFKFTLASLFPDDTRPVDDLRSYRFEYMDDYMREAKKTGAVLIWTALYDIGGGDYYHDRSGFQGGRCPRYPQKWAKVVRKVVERYNNGWGGHELIPIDYVECLNEPLGLGGCSPDKYFEVYKYFSRELSEFNKTAKHPVKLIGFGEPIHTEKGDFTPPGMNPPHRKRKVNLPALKRKPDPIKLGVFRKFVEYVKRNNLAIDAVSIHPYVHGSPYDIYTLTKKYREEMDAQGWRDKELIITEYGTIRVLVGRSRDLNFASQVLAAFQTTTKLFLQGLVGIATGTRVMPSGNPKKQRGYETMFFDRYGNKKPAGLAVELLSFLEKETPYISFRLPPNSDNLGAILCRDKEGSKYSLLFSNCSRELREVKVNIGQGFKFNKIEVYKIGKGEIEKEVVSSLNTLKLVRLEPFEVKLFMLYTE